MNPKAPSMEKVRSITPSDLVLQLVWPAEDVRIVLGEASHPEQAVEDAAPFVPVDGPQLTEAHRQLSVAAQRRLVHKDMERAVHRLKVVFLAVQIYGRVHTLGVEVQMAAGFPQSALADVRRVDQ